MTANTQYTDALAKFENIFKIGEGTYGQVYKGVHKKTKQRIALKRIALDKDAEGVPSTCLREIALLKELNHPNIVKLFDVICTVFEFIDRDLKALLDKLPGKKLQANYVKLLQALAYCHTRRIIHRDLKPQNLLVDNNGTIKLADFGLASRAYTHEVVTLWYRPPEVLMGGKYYSTALDIWSLGCIFIEMATGRNPFPGDSEIDQLYKIFRVMGTPNPTIWPGVEKLTDYKDVFPKWKRNEEAIANSMSDLCHDAQDLALRMLSYVPNTRITAKSALGHRFLSDGLLPIPSISELFMKLGMSQAGGLSQDPTSANYSDSPIDMDDPLFD